MMEIARRRVESGVANLNVLSADCGPAVRTCGLRANSPGARARGVAIASLGAGRGSRAGRTIFGSVTGGGSELGLGLTDRPQGTDPGAAQHLGRLEVVGIGDGLVPGPDPGVVGHRLAVTQHPDPV